MIKFKAILLISLSVLFLACEPEPVEPNESSENTDDNQQLTDQEEEENGTDPKSFQEWLIGDWSITKVKDVVERLTTGEMDTIEYEMDPGDGFLFTENEFEITSFSSVATLPYEVVSQDTLNATMTSQAGEEEYIITIDSISANKMVLTEVYDHSLGLVNDNNNIYIIYELAKKE